MDIDKLIAELEAGLEQSSGMVGDLVAHNFDDAVSAIRALLDRVKALEAALEPMSNYAKIRDDSMGDEDDDLVVLTYSSGFGRDDPKASITLGQCRAACALSRKGESK